MKQNFSPKGVAFSLMRILIVAIVLTLILLALTKPTEWVQYALQSLLHTYVPGNRRDPAIIVTFLGVLVAFVLIRAVFIRINKK